MKIPKCEHIKNCALRGLKYLYHYWALLELVNHTLLPVGITDSHLTPVGVEQEVRVDF